MPTLVFGLPGAFCCLKLPLVAAGSLVLGGEDDRHRLSDDFFFFVSEQPLRAAIPTDYFPFGIKGENRIAYRGFDKQIVKVTLILRAKIAWVAV
jgi:hypothetical protein